MFMMHPVLQGPLLMQTGEVSLTTFYKKNCLQDRKASWVSISKAVGHKAPSQDRAWAATCSPGQLWVGCAPLHSLLTLPSLSSLSRAGSSPKERAHVGKKVLMLSADSRAASYRELLL